MMKTNEMTKGVRVLLRNGWEADMMDNMKGNTRLVKVYGIECEIGSVYSHDIVAYKDGDGDWCQNVEYTPAQLKCKAAVKAMGF